MDSLPKKTRPRANCMAKGRRSFRKTKTFFSQNDALPFIDTGSVLENELTDFAKRVNSVRETS